MSWRDILGAPAEPAAPAPAQQAPLLEVLRDACQGLPIEPQDVHDAMTPEDVADWQAGLTPTENLRAYAAFLVEAHQRRTGCVPGNYTHRAICRHCGPVFLPRPGVVDGCVWCWNRAEGLPIPRPLAVSCDSCCRFRPDPHHRYLGTCAAGERPAPAGAWRTDRRCCPHWLTRTDRETTEIPQPRSRGDSKQ